MKYLKAVKITSHEIEFENGVALSSDHQSDCCESHWLSFEYLSMDDFDGLEFDFSNDNFFKKIEGYGIELIPVKGHSVKIPGYGSNNGYYSTELTLVLSGFDGVVTYYDITQCQENSG